MLVKILFFNNMHSKIYVKFILIIQLCISSRFIIKFIKIFCILLFTYILSIYSRKNEYDNYNIEIT